MAEQDQFKYIINATLKLNTGSLTKLVSDIKEVDKGIKAHFEKAGGGVKVPLTANPDTEQLRKSANRVIESYNRGQVPSIRVPIVADEESISKLQARISEVRKQLSTLSDEKARVNIDTSLIVARGEAEEVQKQVDGIRPVIKVEVVPDETSLKLLKDQIESIKAEIQASVRAVQDHDRPVGGRVGHQLQPQSVGRISRETVRRANTPRDTSNRFLSERKSITDEINTIQDSIKLLEKEEKLALSANEIKSRIDKLTEAQSKGRSVWQPRNEKGVPIKGESQVKADGFDSEIEKYKNLIKQSDQLNSLKKDLSNKLKQRDTLERTVAYKNTSKSKPTPRSNISPDSSLGQTLSEIEAKKKDEKTRQDALDKAEKQRQAEADKDEKKRQSDAEKAEKKRQADSEKSRIKVQRDNERTLKRSQQVSYNRLNRGRGTAETQDRRMGYQQHLEDIPNRYVSLNETRANMQSRVAQLKDLTGGNSNGKTGKEKREQYSPQALAHIQSIIDRLNKDIESLDSEINIERVKLQEHVNKLYGNDSQGRKLQQSLLGNNSKINPNDVIKATIKTQTVANVKSENESKIKAWQEQQAQQELERQWKQNGAHSELPANGPVAKKIAKNQSRQNYLDRKTQSVAKAKYDYDNHRRVYGGNKEYSATDLESMLADPNVSLADSMDIIKNRLHPVNQAQAVAQGKNFQKAYAVNYTDADGNIRSIRTLTTQYTKLGEVIERGDKGFGQMMGHIASKVGIYSLLEGALVGVSEAFLKGIEDMSQFDAQMAEVIATTQKLTGTGTQLQGFYSTVGGTSSMESQVQNNTFQNAESYGVSALNTVMPIEQQVLARQGLVTGKDGKYDASMKDQIVKNIMQFSAISANGEETPDETNDLTKDALSLYQAYYKSGTDNHMTQMNGVFDNLSAMKMRGVNTTSVTDALAELAPDTITSGVDSKQVMAMLGSYNLSDAGASGDDIQTVGRTFFSAIRHADTNDNLKEALKNYAGIDLNSQTVSTPDLINKIISSYGQMSDPDKEAFAGAFAGTSGKGTAMTPKMVKFLGATQGADYQQFMNQDSSGAMAKSWGPFSEKLKTQFDGLVEKLQEFTQLIGKLGVMDSLGLIVKGFSSLLTVVNSVLRSVQGVADIFGNAGIFNVPKFVTQIATLTLAFKGLQAVLNKKAFGSAIGDLLATSPLTGGRTLGVKTTAQRIESELTRSGASPELIASVMPQIHSNRGTTSTRLQSQLARAGVDEETISTIVPQLGNNVTNTAEKSANTTINAVRTATLKDSTSTMLRDTLAFTSADVLANKLSHNPMRNDLTPTVEERKFIPNTIVNPTEYNTSRTALEETISSYNPTKKEKAFSSVGNFLSDALMLGSFSGKGRGVATVAEAGAETIAKKSVLTKFSDWIISVLPALRSFGLLITRLSLLGGAIALGIAGYNYVKNDEAKQTAEAVDSADRNFAKLSKAPKSTRDKTVSQIKSWVNQNNSSSHMDAQTYRMTQSSRLNNNKQLRNKWNLQYHGFGDKAYVTYQDAQKKMHTAHINSKDNKELNGLYDTFKNSGLTDVEKLSDAWNVNTDSLKIYTDELTTAGVISKNLSETMREISTSQKEIDARYGGVTSAGSLQEKIDVTNQGLSKSKVQTQQLQVIDNNITGEYNKTNNAYDAQVQKALSTGQVSQSDISDAVQLFEVTKAANGSLQTVFGNYKALDSTDPTDRKTINSKHMSDQEVKDYNTKQDAITSVLKLYQSKSSTQDLHNSSQDTISQNLDQQYQYQESIKQMTAQLAVAKLGLDAMNASLTTLGAIASASKSLVDISANPMNNGNNDAQITALHTSMGISTAQMNNMVGQNSTIQKQMSQISKDNPTQDFSLNALYNPSGDVSAQQLAYKQLYEQSQQMTQNISNQSDGMYQQLTQLKDLVLNSNAYADSWSRIQQTVQDVKDSIKEASDFQFQMSSVNENAVTTASVTGQSVYDVKGQELNSIRDNALQVNTKLTTDGKSLKSDTSALNQAWQDILQAEGKNFQNAMVNPLKDIVKGFNSSDGLFSSSVNSFGTAVKNFGSIVSQESADAKVKAQAQAEGAPAPSVSNYTSSSTTGKDTNTGRTFKIGAQEGAYDVSLKDIAGGVYKQNNSQGIPNYEKFVYAGQNYGVDPNLLMSIAMAENSGNSHLLSVTNNVGSIKAGSTWHGATYKTTSGTYRKYATMQDGINDLAQLIESKIKAGHNTIPELNANYAQSSYWMNAVAAFMAKATNTTVKTWLGNATSSSGYHLSGNDGGDPNYKGSGSSGSSSSNNSFSKGTKVTTTNDLWLHKSASTSSSSRVKVLPKGSTYTSYGESNGMVNLGNGWVSASYLKGTGGGSPSSTGGNGGVSSMVNWLNSVEGNTSKMKYSYGGAHSEESWSSFLQKAVADCSGLVEQVFKQFNGINLGTTSSQGLYSNNNGGVKVTSKSKLQEGDLVFFGNDASHITHVGVYAGNNQMYTINSKGQPVQKQTMWSNYVGGKHYNTPSSSQNPASSAPPALKTLQGQTSSYSDTVTTDKSILTNTLDQLNTKVFDSIGQAIINGNINDVMGSSGITGKYDAMTQARQDIGTQMIANHHQMTSINSKHDDIVSKMNTASKNKDSASYNLLKQQLDDNNSLIKALQDNTKSLQTLDDSYKKQQQLDPRLNTSTAHDAIVGGINQLKSYDGKGETMSVDFMRVVNEVNNMKSQYLDHTKETQSLQTLFNNYGVESQALTASQSTSDQDSINLITAKIKNITSVLKQFAQGTEQWYSALTNAVQSEQELHDLEQKRMTDAQTMFQLTGQGVQGYVQQRAYVQSRDYVQNSKNLSTGLAQYKSGNIDKGYGVQTGGYQSQASAQKVADYIKDHYGINASVKDAGKGSKYRYSVNTENNLTSDQADSVKSGLKTSKKAKDVSKTGGGSSTEDFNQQLANLQVIADAHNAMTQQMNDYRQAVVDGFKAGAMSIDKYMDKMNQLRDKETESKEQATNMITSITQGFQSSLSDALTQGMQGAMNSPMGFMNSIKSMLSSTISSQLSTTLLQNTGLKDIMNKITSSITSASTSGNPNDIVNMFNNNDFGKEINDALAPFIPMIEQIVGSTKGIFTILQDQVYNAPSGFKIDSYMNEVASKVGYKGIKTMNPNVDSAGAPTGDTGSSGHVSTTKASGSSGKTNSKSSGGATSNGSAENTDGKGSGASSSSSYTSTNGSNKNPSGPPSSTSSTTSTGKAVAKTTADVNLRKGPSTSYSIIKTLKKGTSWNVLGHKNGWLELGNNEWADENYFSGSFGPNLGGSSSSSSSSSSSKTKHTKESLNLRSGAGYGNNVLESIPKGATVDYMGLVNGWAHVSYKGKSGYVGPSYLYHTGGIAGVTNFASAQGLKPNELSAILQNSETIFQPKQLDDLVNGAMQAGSGSSGGGVNLTVNVNIDGGGNYDQKGIEAVVETAVSKAMSQFKKTTKMNNLTWKGTSY